MKKVSSKTIARLSLYRFLLDTLKRDGVATVFSHDMAGAANCSAAQVRRDLMEIEYTGSPVHGYSVEELHRAIDSFLDDPDGRNVALVGVGNLGRAILTFFRERRPKLQIVACFDVNENKTNRMIGGCFCHAMDEIEKVVREKNIRIGVICVPPADAQAVADRLINAGVRGLLNFSPVRLRTRYDVFVDDVDMTVSLDKVAYFSRLRTEEQGVNFQ